MGRRSVGEGFPPVLVKGNGIPGGKVFVEGQESSQFISSLLLTAPYTKNDFEMINFDGDHFFINDYHKEIIEIINKKKMVRV